MRIPSGVTDQYIYFVAVDATDFTTRETAQSSYTVYRSRNGAASAAMTTPTINETDVTNMPGVYELLLDEDMTIAAGNDSEEMVFHITHTGMHPVTRTIELYRPKITAGNTLGVESDGDLTQVNALAGHTVQTGDSFARLGAPVGASASADIAAVKAETVLIVADTNELQVDWVNDGRLDLLLDAIPTTAMRGTDSAYTGTPPTAAAIADAVWDEDATGHQTAGTFGKAIGDPVASSETIFGAVVTAASGANVGADTTAIKAKTDDLVFTVANQVDANVQYINDAAVVGDGNATPWDGA